MGILEIHFHDSEFEWEFDPGTGDAPTIPFGDDGESDRSGSSTGTASPSATSKLRSIGTVAFVVVGAIAFNRLRSRRARRAAEDERETRGRRLSLSRLRSR